MVSIVVREPRALEVESANVPEPKAGEVVVSKELTIVGSRLNRRLIPQVVTWLAEGRLKPESMITQVFAAAAAREAFDLIEKQPQRTLKVQLDFS
jgi:L-gulonate 5-dehydrogenase